ncbi:4-hydroxy-tetrahydrodipicolinate synthase [Paenibacillus sp. JX-17]|uniref:4-hydroxy-tetrahydrodipicolinate synthase n=1 Tax=Paenibacillus lacisoli TaxID=3064525 RepID=A0ABT9C943_9BACL|nr:4-hydroxy-tetrahydrodipicolinate synthase [Paenibacillus sp. JX-17]MDO7905775.1 4-hydroxy-tetrahydrodipicolinate synthase [Paenibacillus sp. JX-17]
MDFGRLITAMVTPFNDQGEIDWEQTSKLIDYLIEEQQTDSIVVSGTTGESPTLSDEEKMELFKFSVKHAAGRCKIIAGTGSNNTKHSVHLTKEAELAGADGVLLVVPYYNKPNQEGMYRHFESIANATSLPCILYNVPGRTGASLSAATTLRLAQISNIAATKECAATDQVTRIAAEAPEGFRVYSGDDASALPAMSVGAYGVISVASHIVGKDMKKMIQAFFGGDSLDAVKIHQKLHPIFKGLFECPDPLPNPVAVKYALTLRGLNVGSVRLPLVPPSGEEEQFIRKLIDQA